MKTVLCLLFCCISCVNSTPKSKPLPLAPLYFPEGTHIDLGQIQEDKIQHFFPAINQSLDTILVLNAKSNAGYVVPYTSTKIIPPNDTLWVGAKILTRNRKGKRISKVVLTYRSAEERCEQYFTFAWEK